MIFQYRANIGNDNEYSIDAYSGGNAIKHIAKTISYVRRYAVSKTRDAGSRFGVTNSEKGSGASKKGFVISMKLIKTKISGAIEGTTAIFDFYHMKGIDKVGSLFETAYANGFIEKVGQGIFKIGEETIKGIENTKQYFIKNESIQEEALQYLVKNLRFHNIDFNSEMIDEEEEIAETNTPKVVEDANAANITISKK